MFFVLPPIKEAGNIPSEGYHPHVGKYLVHHSRVMLPFSILWCLRSRNTRYGSIMVRSIETIHLNLLHDLHFCVLWTYTEVSLVHRRTSSSTLPMLPNLLHFITIETPVSAFITRSFLFASSS